MTLLLILAALLLAFAGFCVFGLSYMLTGPRMFDELAGNREQQVLGGVILTAAIALICLPVLAPVLIFPASHAQVFADTFTGQIPA